MASASDVTVVIPVGLEYSTVVVQRAIDSAWDAGAGEVIVYSDDQFEMRDFDHCDLFYGKTLISSGVCHARNYAITQAQLDLILPLDSDDYLLPSAIERMVTVWEIGKVVYGGWGETTRLVFEDRVNKQAPPPEMLSRKHICHATYLFDREDWFRVDGYDKDFEIGAEDWAFMIALANAGCELIRLDGDPLYVKTMNENGRTHKAIRHKDMIRQLLLEKFPEYMTR